MANIKFGDFHKPYQYEIAKKQERKSTQNNKNIRKNKKNRWQDDFES